MNRVRAAFRPRAAPSDGGAEDFGIDDLLSGLLGGVGAVGPSAEELDFLRAQSENIRTQTELLGPTFEESKRSNQMDEYLRALGLQESRWEVAQQIALARDQLEQQGKLTTRQLDLQEKELMHKFGVDRETVELAKADLALRRRSQLFEESTAIAERTANPRNVLASALMQAGRAPTGPAGMFRAAHGGAVMSEVKKKGRPTIRVHSKDKPISRRMMAAALGTVLHGPSLIHVGEGKNYEGLRNRTSEIVYADPGSDGQVVVAPWNKTTPPTVKEAQEAVLKQLRKSRVVRAQTGLTLLPGTSGNWYAKTDDPRQLEIIAALWQNKVPQWDTTTGQMTPAWIGLADRARAAGLTALADAMGKGFDIWRPVLTGLVQSRPITPTEQTTLAKMPVGTQAGSFTVTAPGVVSRPSDFLPPSGVPGTGTAPPATAGVAATTVLGGATTAPRSAEPVPLGAPITPITIPTPRAAKLRAVAVKTPRVGRGPFGGFGVSSLTAPAGGRERDIFTRQDFFANPLRGLVSFAHGGRVLPKGKRKIEKVLHEYKEGSLRSSSGAKVKSRRQAVAIALSEQRRAESGSRGKVHRGRRRPRLAEYVIRAADGAEALPTPTDFIADLLSRGPGGVTAIDAFRALQLAQTQTGTIAGVLQTVADWINRLSAGVADPNAFTTYLQQASTAVADPGAAPSPTTVGGLTTYQWLQNLTERVQAARAADPRNNPNWDNLSALMQSTKMAKWQAEFPMGGLTAADLTAAAGASFGGLADLLNRYMRGEQSSDDVFHAVNEIIAQQPEFVTAQTREALTTLLENPLAPGARTTLLLSQYGMQSLLFAQQQLAQGQITGDQFAAMVRARMDDPNLAPANEEVNLYGGYLRRAFQAQALNALRPTDSAIFANQALPPTPQSQEPFPGQPGSAFLEQAFNSYLSGLTQRNVFDYTQTQRGLLEGLSSSFGVAPEDIYEKTARELQGFNPVPSGTTARFGGLFG